MKDACSLFIQRPLLKVAVAYCHVPGDHTHTIWAKRFVDSWHVAPPHFEAELVVCCNGANPTPEIESMFQPLKPKWFSHDDSGWDIGAYQAFSRTTDANMVVYLGGSSYFRKTGWLARMVEVFQYFEGVGLFGCCGHLGQETHGIYPHIRTTGFWCSPILMNTYPLRIQLQSQRYPFEHGVANLSKWAMAMGIPARIADASHCWDYPHWNDNPEGYHRGTQNDLLVGDRMTCPPMYPHP